MPLAEGDSEEVIRRNVEELVAAGHPADQAAEIANDYASRRRHDSTAAGMPVVVETPAGGVRRWRQPDGRSGETTMEHDYGYFPGTVGRDGDGVDVFVGPNPDAETAYVVHQMAPPDFRTYDEDKVMCGFTDPEEAKASYLRHYDDPRFFGAMTAVPVDQLQRQLRATGEVRRDGSAPARVWLSQRYGVDVARVDGAEVIRRAARILGVPETAPAVTAAIPAAV